MSESPPNWNRGYSSFWDTEEHQSDVQDIPPYITNLNQGTSNRRNNTSRIPSPSHRVSVSHPSQSERNRNGSLINVPSVRIPTSSNPGLELDENRHFSPNTKIALSTASSDNDTSAKSDEDVAKLMFGVEEFRLNPEATPFTPKSAKPLLSPPIIFGFHDTGLPPYSRTADPEIAPETFKDPFSKPVPDTGTSLGHLLTIPPSRLPELAYPMLQISWVYDKAPDISWPSFVAGFLHHLLLYSVPDHQMKQFVRFLGNSEWHTTTAKRILDVQLLAIQQPGFKVAFAINEQFIAIEKEINRGTRFLNHCSTDLKSTTRLWGLRKALKITLDDEVPTVERMKALISISQTRNLPPRHSRINGPSNQSVMRAIIDRSIPAQSPPPSALFSPSIAMDQAIVSRSLDTIAQNTKVSASNVSPALAMDICLGCGNVFKALCVCRHCKKCNASHPPGPCHKKIQDSKE